MRVVTYLVSLGVLPPLHKPIVLIQARIRPLKQSIKYVHNLTPLPVNYLLRTLPILLSQLNALPQPRLRSRVLDELFRELEEARILPVQVLSYSRIELPVEGEVFGAQL